MIYPSNDELAEACAALNAVSLAGFMDYFDQNNDFRRRTARHAAEIVRQELLMFINFTYDRPGEQRGRCPRFYWTRPGCYEESL